MNKKSRQTARKKLISCFTAVWVAVAAAGITTAGFANSESLSDTYNSCSAACFPDTADTPDSIVKDRVCTPDTPEIPIVSDLPETSDISVRRIAETPDTALKKPKENKSTDTAGTKDKDTSQKTASDKDEKKSTADTAVKTSSEKTSSKASSEKQQTESKKDNSSKNTSSEKEKSDTKKQENKDSQNEKPKTKQPPKEYLIDVAQINQNNNLVTGCEIVSAKMVLDYYGKKNITFDEMKKHIEFWDLKVSDKGKLYGKTPYEAFIGNPDIMSGFGCFPPVIEDMIDDFDFEDLYAEDTCGLPLDFLAKTYVSQDIPVLVWATVGMSESFPTYTWYGVGHKGEPNKKTYTWLAGEHCLVLVGYDKNYYSFADPMAYQKVTKYDKKLVEKRYKEIGMQSMIIRKAE
ncbi:MAG: C39 family peptidase [Clostridia bacterium]|nr:C39 family peptidase [Clostridia bacterium]